jgi:hypothetical protein
MERFAIPRNSCPETNARFGVCRGGPSQHLKQPPHCRAFLRLSTAFLFGIRFSLQVQWMHRRVLISDSGYAIRTKNAGACIDKYLSGSVMGHGAWVRGRHVSAQSLEKIAAHNPGCRKDPLRPHEPPASAQSHFIDTRVVVHSRNRGSRGIHRGRRPTDRNTPRARLPSTDLPTKRPSRYS